MEYIIILQCIIMFILVAICLVITADYYKKSKEVKMLIEEYKQEIEEIKFKKELYRWVLDY